MRAVIQRVTSARVDIDGHTTGNIDSGLLVLLGVHKHDTLDDVSWLSDKTVHLRIFDDSAGKMNHSLLDTGGSMLVVSQFTLLGDCRRGRRPSWSTAAPVPLANTLYEAFIKAVQTLGIRCETGEFQTMMDVTLMNSGPVTMLLDSHKNF